MGVQKAGQRSYGDGSNTGWAVSNCNFLVGCLGVQGQWLYWNNIVGSTWHGGGGVRVFVAWRIKRREYCDLYYWVCMGRRSA